MNTTLSSGSEDDDPLREARAYNHSIYLMLGVPYLLVATFGVVIYRGIRAADKRLQASMPNSDDVSGDHGIEASPEI
jgi:hypothetical protein